MMLVHALLLLAGGLPVIWAVGDLNDTNIDKNGTVHLEYVLLDEEFPCKRTCVKDGPPMVCRYKFVVEWYETLTKACYDCPLVREDCFRKDCVPALGFRRPIVVINRKMPGTSIEVCQGDQVVVDLVNKMTSETTAIHWHGQHMLKNPYMDGVPYISQCPILPWQTFQYDFEATNPGTHFWHSHNGVQRADGAFGPLIVRQPPELNPHVSLYDHDLSEHVVTILDWDLETGMKKFISHHHSVGDNKPSNLLVNGLGILMNKQNGWDVDEGAVNVTARFKVEQGQRYRFRVINAGFLNCPIEMTIDNHTLLVISSDGSDFKPINATSLVTYAGERFDFILNADQPDGLYWMRFRGLMDCDERFTRAHQVAVLEYDGAQASDDDFPEGDPSWETATNEGVQVNSLNKGTEHDGEEFISVPEFESLSEKDPSLNEKPDYQLFFAYDFYKIHNPHYYDSDHYAYDNVSVANQVLTPQINRISMHFPNIPLMSQRNQFNDSMFCNITTVKNCTQEFCECPHVVQVPLNKVVELVVIDEGVAYDANHPMHLHGYGFRVVGMERLGNSTTAEEFRDRDSKGLIKRNLLNAPKKDTVTIPDGGYTILRFVSNNPGYWIFHCHIEFHVELGMAFVIKVGEDKEMLPVPKNFPKCGDYQAEAQTSSAPAMTQRFTKAFAFFVLLLALFSFTL